MRRLVLVGDLSLDGFLGREGLDPAWAREYDDRELSQYRQRVVYKAGVHASGDGWDVARLLEVTRDGGYDELAPVVVEAGPELAQDLTRRGLVDEYRVVIHPVVLGEGWRFFASHQRLIQISTRFFTRGSEAHTYVPADKYRDHPPPYPWSASGSSSGSASGSASGSTGAESPGQDEDDAEPEQSAERPAEG